MAYELGSRMRTDFLRVVALAALAGHAVAAGVQATTFTDVTGDSGIDYIQWDRNVWIPKQMGHSVVYVMTGGAAAADYDNDGWTDLFVTRMGQPDILYRNRGDGTFEDKSLDAGFTTALPTNGAAWADVDNDGDPDLYVSGVNTSQHYLYINDGQGHFSEQAIARGADIPSADRYGMSVAVGDYDRDGYLDLHTNHWGYGYGGIQAARLLHNRGATQPGYFDDVTNVAKVSLANVPAHSIDIVGRLKGIFSFTSRLTDLDDDGWADLVIAGDFHTSRIFWNNGNGTFTDGTKDAGVGSDENGMGSAVGDYDGDGDLDWFITSIYDDRNICDGLTCAWGGTGNRLYRNEGERVFSDATNDADVRNGGWGWGAAFVDYDHDGDLDLVQTGGYDHNLIEFDKPFNNQPLQLFRNDGGVYSEVATDEGMTGSGSGKGLLTLDYDNDGDMDVFVVNNQGQPFLYRNDTNGTAAWLQIDTVGTLSNRDGIGARIELDPDNSTVGDEIVRHVSGGSHFLAQSEFLAHFGLNNHNDPIDLIRITWPSGTVQELTDIPVNQRLYVTEAPDPATGVVMFTGAMVIMIGTRRIRDHA